MFVWFTARAVIILSLMLVSNLTMGQAMQCASDLNGDGDIDSIGEYAACINDSAGKPFCAIGAVACTTSESVLCPLDKTKPCIDGKCTVTQSANCVHVPGGVGNPLTTYRCPLDGKQFTDTSSEAVGRACHTYCTSFRKTESCSTSTSAFTCPLNKSISCQSIVGNAVPQCTANACTDINSIGVVESLPIDSSMYVDDGAKGLNGVCDGQTRIFSGRPMSCRLPGAKSAWKNCCTNNKGKVYYDSSGSVVESTLTNKAITATAAAAWAAGSAYTTAMSAGATGAQAAQQGGQAFVNSLQGAFDPTSLAIAIAIALVMEWLANACDQHSLETAALRASRYCMKIGEICTQKFLGSCTQKEEVNCCYNSMLARIVNEQGQTQLKGFSPITSQQLKKGWPKNLDCGGFTPEQFQSIDFQSINFAEYNEHINESVRDRLDTEGDAAIERFKK